MYNKVNEVVAKGKELGVLEAFLVDYRTKLHVRQLAKLLGMNHATVAITLKRMGKKNIMKSEQEGRNKKYFLNLDNILTKNYIENAEHTRTMKYVEKHFLFKKLLSEFSPIIFKETTIILFGSYAKESYNDKSDIDILIFKNNNEKEVTKSLKKFGERHNKKIQIQAMTGKDFEKGLMEKDTLVREIIKNHIILNNIQVIVDKLWRYYNDIR